MYFKLPALAVVLRLLSHPHSSASFQMPSATPHFTHPAQFQEENLCHCLSCSACLVLLLVNAFLSLGLPLICVIRYHLLKKKKAGHRRAFAFLPAPQSDS